MSDRDEQNDKVGALLNRPQLTQNKELEESMTSTDHLLSKINRFKTNREIGGLDAFK